MDTIPQDVTEAVRAAAGAAPGYRADLTDVRRRVRRRRKRQAVLSAVGAVVLVVATGFGVIVRREESRLNDLPAADDAPPEPGLQRLLLNGALGRYQPAAEGGRAVELGASTRMGVLEPSGRIDTLDVVGAGRWDRAVALPDGAVVAVNESEFRLVVTRPDGTVRLQRNLSHDEEWMSLLTATADTAYLWRQTDLVAHDIASGTETPVVNMYQLGLINMQGAFTAADVNDGVLVLAPKETTGCSVELLRRPLAANREPVRSEWLDIGVGNCEQVTGIRLSPDGAMVAVSYQTANHDFEVVVFRIADQRIVARGGGGTGDLVVDGVRPYPLVAIAWQTPFELRGAWYLTNGDEPFRLHTFFINW
ncbi:hypothetical protein [Actinoplanes couchii]|uniref:Uncharacterized protein n=1 Tax=Actinoplanes couchii TaxID=403638 RepID=A0ABQ3X916_9ACTN|nr:hypothetical protein [Actinoplanes couchii]MDR6325831.1 hypothetical protein [Actinoplanes couchii]GID55000.1 hypothetical protein Aco03nite_034040 [Actinoplanes couchii]